MSEKKLQFVKTVKAYSLEDLETRVNSLLASYNRIYSCKVRFIPLFDSKGNMIYVALIEVYE